MFHDFEPKFIEPMECLPIPRLPEGPNWVYEIKLDGYRAEAIRTADGVEFYSRNGKSLSKKFPYIVEALSDLPPDTIVDGELVALDESGRPEFNRLQNHSGAAQHIRYFVFDLVVLKGRDLTKLPFSERRKLLARLQFTNQRIGPKPIERLPNEPWSSMRSQRSKQDHSQDCTEKCCRKQLTEPTLLEMSDYRVY